MNKKDLKKLSKSQLIKLLLKEEKRKPSPKPRPTPRKTVNKMVQNYIKKMVQDYVKQAVQEYVKQTVPTPEPRKSVKKPVPAPRTKKLMDKPVPASRTKIEQTDKALKGYTKSYTISIKNNKDPLAQLQNTRKAIEHRAITLLNEMKGFKYVETLKVTFSKMSGGEIVIKTAYFNSIAQTIINELEIADSLQLSKQQILNKIAQWISEGSGWTIQSVDNHYLNIVKYKPLKGSSYIQLPSELRNSAKGLINMKNEDNECFRWCHIRHLNPQDKDPQRIKKVDKLYVKNLDYSGIQFPVSKKQYHRIEKQNKININVFCYKDKEPYPIYLSKEKYEDHMELLLILKMKTVMMFS